MTQGKSSFIEALGRFLCRGLLDHVSEWCVCLQRLSCCDFGYLSGFNLVSEGLSHRFAPEHRPLSCSYKDWCGNGEEG